MIVGKPMANPLDGFYCPECGFNVAADEDGLCQRCGLDTSTGEMVREHCAAVGLHLVTAADKAVLDAVADVELWRWHAIRVEPEMAEPDGKKWRQLAAAVIDQRRAKP